MIIQNQIDNKTGKINYVLTLLNPAPTTQGNGQLFKITFKAKQLGKTKVAIQTAKFGTRTGKIITSLYQKNLAIHITNNPFILVDTWILMLVIGFIILILALLIFIMKRKKIGSK